MPYIKREFQERLDSSPVADVGYLITTPGDLNYTITRIIDTFIKSEGKNYTNINAAIGVLECAKLELYRRIAAPYEDKKIIENGDVYTA